jgi:hypothetical protein
MHTASTQLKIQSFIHGLLMPVPGMKTLEKQIELDLAKGSEKSTIFCFALGHMAVAYPVIIGAGYLFYSLVERIQI